MKSVLKGFGDVAQTSISGRFRERGNWLKIASRPLDALLAQYVFLVFRFFKQHTLRYTSGIDNAHRIQILLPLLNFVVVVRMVQKIAIGFSFIPRASMKQKFTIYAEKQSRADCFILSCHWYYLIVNCAPTYSLNKWIQKDSFLWSFLSCPLDEVAHTILAWDRLIGLYHIEQTCEQSFCLQH